MKFLSHVRVCLLVCVLLLSSCTLAKISGRSPVPLLLNTPPAKLTDVEHFSVSKMRTFDYTGSFDVSEVLNEIVQNKKVDAITNLTIEIKSDVGTFFVNLVTLGIANAIRFEVSGDFVRAPDGLGSIIENGTVIGQARTGEPLNMQPEDLTAHQAGNIVFVKTAEGFTVVATH